MTLSRRDFLRVGSGAIALVGPAAFTGTAVARDMPQLGGGADAQETFVHWACPHWKMWPAISGGDLLLFTVNPVPMRQPGIYALPDGNDFRLVRIHGAVTYRNRREVRSDRNLMTTEFYAYRNDPVVTSFEWASADVPVGHQVVWQRPCFRMPGGRDHA